MAAIEVNGKKRGGEAQECQISWLKFPSSKMSRIFGSSKGLHPHDFENIQC